MNALLEVRSLTKSFGGLRAVDGVSFKVEEGKILSIIGPNGAGKTTLFNLITGALAPDSGDVLSAPRASVHAGGPVRRSLYAASHRLR